MGRKSRKKKERRQHSRERRAGYQVPPRKRYPTQPLASDGLTDAERDVAQLCRKVFLSMWTYPNVYRAERQPNGRVISKEVCDLLVVFGDHVLIFSDKDCEFPASEDVDRDWRRWYCRAVRDSAKQLFGAERTLKEQGDPLFLDKGLTTPFPLTLPPPDLMRVHRIVIAHGACRRCRESVGGNGTLMIDPSIIGDDHFIEASRGGAPFAIGQVDPRKGYVHVLDDAAFVLLMRVLDTASDFTAYLSKKEQLITTGRLGFAAGEEALLGWYMGQLNEKGEHDFVGPLSGDGKIAVDERWWHRFATGVEAASKFEADRVSYGWDELIESFTRHFQAGTSHYLTDSTPASMEAVLRFFVRENRLRRRALMNALLTMISTTPENIRRLQVIPPMTPGDPYWVLLLLPFPRGVPYEDYRQVRRAFLESCCMVVRLDFPDACDIVGFATEPGFDSGRSEDAVYFDARYWNDELAAEAAERKRSLQILTTARMNRMHVKEYPVSQRQVR